MQTLLNDLRVTLRQHVRRPGFAVTVVVTLAFAIGAATAVTAVVTGILFRALPYAAPERLVWVASVRADNPDAPFSLPEFLDYRDRTRSLAGLAAYTNWSASLSGTGATERLQGARLSANAFDVLGISAVAGRLFDERDDRADAPPVVVLSHRLWRRQFGGSPGVIGQTARINGQPFVVVGVLPATFPLPLRNIDIITPLAPERDPLRHLRNSVNFLRLFGRLAPSSTQREAEAELSAICRSLWAQFPVEYARKDAVRVKALRDVLVADAREALIVLFAAVLLVLLTACANLAALTLARANARRGELLMRTALGASRWQLIRPFIVDGVMLAVAGSGLAWFVAQATLRGVVRWAPASVPRLNEVSLGGLPVALMVALTVTVTTLLMAVPMRATALVRRSSAFQPSGRGALANRGGIRLRNGLVMAQIAAALVLLLATTELARHVRELSRAELGFEAGGVFQARVAIPPTNRTPDDVSRFYERLSGQLVTLPGVERVGVISVAPFSGLLRTVPFTVAGEATTPGERTMANMRAISPDYLSVVKTPMLSGRAFTEDDRANAAPVALVSAALANRVFAGAAVGRRLSINDNNSGPRTVDIVGVVGDVRHAAIDLPPALDIYLPLRQLHPDGVSFIRDNQFWMIRTASDPASFSPTFQAVLRALDPDAAVSNLGAMQDSIDASLGPRRFNLGVLAAFALTTILLAVIGLHGLVSHAVGRRRPELGLRLALGATRRDVQWLILRQAVALGVIGVLAGAGLAIGLRQTAARLLPGLAFNLRTAGVLAVLLIGVAVVAAWLPARRAARIEPALTLRGDG